MTLFNVNADFPAYRPRRNRRDDFTRRLVRENVLTVNDLIYPVFVMEGEGVREPVPSMPGVLRYSPDTVVDIAKACAALGIPVMAVFPVIDPSLKTPDGIEAVNPKGLVPRVVAQLKEFRCADRRCTGPLYQPRAGWRD
jgi:porphobilinogen synthase